MKWVVDEAECGDAVRVKIGPLYHFGIFVSYDEVIAFGYPPTHGTQAKDIEVVSTTADVFAGGGFVEVGVAENAERRLMRSPQEIVSAARARLGEKGYDIIHNNCEHFVNSCLFGMKKSDMTERLREKMRAIPIVDVYVAQLPFQTETDEISPPSRAKEINACKTQQERDRQYYAWKLLEYGLMRSLGLKASATAFEKKRGKWGCAQCCFCVSYCDDVVAAAVSRKPIGVGVAAVAPERFVGQAQKKMLTPSEYAELDSLPDAERAAKTNELVAQKEALFRRGNDKKFSPRKLETAGESFATKMARAKDGKSYMVSVVSPDAARAVFRPVNVEIQDRERDE